jgi:beta-mannosidase
MPGTADNPLWNRHTSWWVEWPRFVEEHGREPRDLEEYVAWSQSRQSKALSIAVKACKDRFPRCGGVLLWTGHDCFPCAANTSIVDFDGNPKPAALALKKNRTVGGIGCLTKNRTIALSRTALVSVG